MNGKRTSWTFFVWVVLFWHVAHASEMPDYVVKKDLLTNIGHTLGFTAGQAYALDKIAKRYPGLEPRVKHAKLAFDMSYKSSIQNMEGFLEHSQPGLLEQFKVELTNKLPGQLDHMGSIDQSTAERFIQTVLDRSKGEIETPAIETLLMFNPRYVKNPEMEMVDGHRLSYTSMGTGKAKGIKFSVEYPRSWVAKEAKRPNIVQKFHSENGLGGQNFMVIIKQIDIPRGMEITQKDVDELLNDKDMQDMAGERSKVIGYGQFTLERIPGYWMQFEIEEKRGKHSMTMETVMYGLHYQNYLIMLQGHVTKSFNGKPVPRNDFAQFEPVFEYMANSFVLHNQYLQ
jgi:hypothetical protein